MLRTIKALVVSLLRSLVELAESLWYETTAFALTLALSALSLGTWFVSSLFSAILLVAALLVILLIVNIRLLIILRALGKTPWSFRWSLRRCIAECIAGCLAAGLGIMGCSLLGGVFGVATLASGNDPHAALWGSALAIVVIFGVPGYRFWRITRRFHQLRVTEKILARLDARYAEHLSHLLPGPGISFPVEASLTRLMGQQGNLASPPQQTPPDMIAFPALSASLPPPSPEVPPTHADVTLAQICEFFDVSRRQIIMTSGSGGGKSTQLYLLAHTLLVEAQTILNQLFQEVAKGAKRKKLSEMPPLPIVLDISILDIALSVESHERVRDWQRETLVKVYGVRRGTAKRWVTRGHITSLFDSLDVLEPSESSLNDQSSYFGSIHRYLREHENTSIVVCCGEAQYQSYLNYMTYLNEYASWRADDSQQGSLSGSELSLPVVVLQPLSPAAIEQALSTAGNAGNAGNAGSVGDIRRAMPHDEALTRLLRSPMMLSLALAGATDGEPELFSDAADSPVDWRERIGYRYATRMLSAFGGRRSWSPPQAEATLAWLGYQLRKRKKHVFHLEELQFDWLPSPASKAIYDRQIRFLRVLFTIAATLLFGIAISRTVSLVYSLGGAEFIQGTTETVGNAAVIGDVSRIIFGILGGFGVAISLGNKITRTRGIRLIKHIHPNADARWRKAPSIAMLGLCALLTAAFIGGPVIVPNGALLIGLSACVALGLLVAWCGRLATERNHFPRPNRGLSNAIKSSLALMAIFTLIGLAVGSVIAMTALSVLVAIGAAIDLRFVAVMLLVCAGVLALTAAIFAGLSTGFSNGGGSVLRHVILRRALKKSRIVPPKFERFLDTLRETGLLRREGDGYAFELRSSILRDYFADYYEKRYLMNQQQLVAPLPRSKRLGRQLLRVGRVFAPRRIARAVQPRRRPHLG